MKQEKEGMAAMSNFKGTPREYGEAVMLGVIDKRIRELVATLNVPGVISTHASCEGHRLPFIDAWQTAFVMFRTDVDTAAALAQRIRLDLHQPESRRLNYYWDLDARFDDQGQLLFSLSCPYTRFKRTRLDADFSTLRQYVQQTLDARHQASCETPNLPYNSLLQISLTESELALARTSIPSGLGSRQ